MKRSILGAACALLVAGTSQAAVLTFDDVNNGIPGNYAGFTWVNLSIVNPNNGQFGYANSGAVNAILSGTSVGLRSGAGLVQFSASTPFIFNSGYFTSVWNDGLTITANGLRSGLITQTMSFTVNPTAPLLVNFNWTNLDAVTFSSSGGTFHTGLTGGTGTNFAFDNLVVNVPVPEPASAATLLLGLLGVSACLARRRRAVDFSPSRALR